MASNKRMSAVQRREEQVENEHHLLTHQPKVQNALKIKLDHLKTFSALTPNQEKFFEIYKGGAYFMGLFGSPGVGKCQGENVEVSLLVQDEFYEKFMR